MTHARPTSADRITVRPGLLLLLSIALAAGSACQPAEMSLAAPSTAAQTSTVAFVGANVIPMDTERVLTDQTVVVHEGRITRIGPSVEVTVPDGATIVDARGKYLMPGIAEMHAHIPGAQTSMDVVERTLFLYLAGGVTTIRGMQGNPLHLDLRAQANRGEILSPRIYAAAPGLSGNLTPEAAVRRVEEHHAAGYDLLKVGGGSFGQSFDAMAAAAHRIGIPLAGHVPADVGLTGALEARYSSIDHLDAYVEALAGWPEGGAVGNSALFGFNLTDQVDPGGIRALAEATTAAGVWNAPTQSLMEHLADPDLDIEAMMRWPEMRYMPPQTISAWVDRRRSFMAAPMYTPERGRRYLEIRRNLISSLHEAGAGLILGSDAPQWWNVPGFSARREIGYMVQAGLTPFQALETATRNPAVYFNVDDEWGTVAEGKVADLILLDANPLEDVHSLWGQAGVMVRGQWLPQSEIETRLDAIAAEVR